MHKEDNDNFKVYVRVRPFIENEVKTPSVQVQNKTLTISSTRGLVHKTVKYEFEQIFNQSDLNSHVYQRSLQPLLPRLLQGFNTTYFAYGTTGAGKTHTMLGKQSSPGLIYQTLDQLLQNKTFSITMSYLEIYNEKIKDLLSVNQNLAVVEDGCKGVWIPGLTEFPVKTIEEVSQFVSLGNSNRKVAPTKANAFSTRSHAVLQVNVQTQRTRGKLMMIDLAGSQRAAVTENKGERMREGANINKSLLALGNCIAIISNPNSKQKFVPYRDSKLTRLVKESLGGNTITVMIACISPSASSVQETLNTLKYADKARFIQKRVQQNFVSDSKTPKFQELKDQISMLKQELQTNSNLKAKECQKSKELVNLLSLTYKEQ